MDPMDIEYNNRIGILRKNITEKKRNLKTIPDSEKKQRYFEIKRDSIKVKNLISNIQSPKFKKHFEEAYKDVFFDAIYYFYKYLELSEQINWNEYLDLCQLIYDYSLEEKLDILICYDFREELFEMDEFSPSINILIKLLEKCIETVHDSNLRKMNQFQYYNLLGDLYFHIYLLLNEKASYIQNRLDESLNSAIELYRLALKVIEQRGRESQPINYLSYFIRFFNERGLSNLYVFNKKYEILTAEFPQILNN